MWKAACMVSMVVVGTNMPAHAAESIEYKYDARGRLVKVVRSGASHNGATTDYQHDRAQNRTRVVTSGAASP